MGLCLCVGTCLCLTSAAAIVIFANYCACSYDEDMIKEKEEDKMVNDTTNSSTTKIVNTHLAK